MDSAAKTLPPSAPSVAPKRLNPFERYLSLWVALCMGAGVLLGLAAPALMQALRGLEFGSGSQINAPIAVLIWLMITPMMMKVDFGSIRDVGRRPRGLLVTLFVNWIVKPFSMAAFGWLFFRHPWLERHFANVSQGVRTMAHMKKNDYEREIEALQHRLNDLMHWAVHERRRMLVIFEGRDAAGKGGAINAIVQRLNPRHAHVVALAKPTEREDGQWYFQRYLSFLPSVGELVLMDRSWYNRAGVERVMGYCTDAQYRRFLEDAPVFERLLADDGIQIRKYWLSADQTHQEERFAERAADPLKRWKLSPVDLEARTRYREYGRARDAMFRATHTPYAPWTVIDFNDQRRGRLNLIRHLLEHAHYEQIADRPVQLPPLDAAPARERFTGPIRPIRGWY